MSANNYILIDKFKNNWGVRVKDVGCGSGNYLQDFDTLEEAIKYANKYMDENEVEYGIHFNGF